MATLRVASIMAHLPNLVSAITLDSNFGIFRYFGYNIQL
jgi:hypothetical protein